MGYYPKWLVLQGTCTTTKYYVYARQNIYSEIYTSSILVSNNDWPGLHLCVMVCLIFLIRPISNSGIDHHSVYSPQGYALGYADLAHCTTKTVGLKSQPGVTAAFWNLLSSYNNITACSAIAVIVPVLDGTMQLLASLTRCFQVNNAIFLPRDFY